MPDYAPPPLWMHRVVAVIEVLVCSDFPTQLALAALFTVMGYGAMSGGHLRVGYVVGLSLADAVLLIGLIFVFLYSHGESPREVLLGRRSVVAEAAFGIPLTVVALVLGVGVLAAIVHFVPRLHTVAENPLQDLLQSKRDAALFALVVVVAGGIREEIQRAFLLHRFEVWLGGGRVGLIVTSVAFGAGHLLQGADAGIATGMLGMLWAFVYLRRRSAVAPMVSHAGFDLVQIAQFLVR